MLLEKENENIQKQYSKEDDCNFKGEGSRVVDQTCCVHESSCVAGFTKVFFVVGEDLFVVLE